MLVQMLEQLRLKLFPRKKLNMPHSFVQTQISKQNLRFYLNSFQTVATEISMNTSAIHGMLIRSQPDLSRILSKNIINNYTFLNENMLHGCLIVGELY